ncbi:MAG: biopolymer transporter ExbD [Cyanothece sp. SIO1E1]|nr:biopolymer transporter ExbD [Cyanothece sp. SIO1E1]
MKFRTRQKGSQIPTVNLVPMMDVLMTVLTFFIIISMTLTGQQILNINLPQSVEGAETAAPRPNNETQPLIVGLDQQGEIILANQPVSFNQLAERLRQYLSNNPEGTVILKADRELTYKEVAQFLDKMRGIGGRRISLAVE